MSVLQKIADHKREALAEIKRLVPLSKLQDDISALSYVPKPFLPSDNSKYQTPRLILEIKPFSPSAGHIVATRPDRMFDPAPWVAIYQRFAVALSILTDERHFGGSLALLSSVRAMTHLPLLRKDFILEAYQLCEARAAGADAVLLIVKLLPELNQLGELIQQARFLGLTPVIEVQNESELELALMVMQPDTDVLLVNNRNLDTLVLNLQTTLTLGGKIPPSQPWIAASGIEAAEQLGALCAVANTFLIGTAAMKQPLDALESFLESLLAAPHRRSNSDAPDC
ncbi:MAG: indole-3-glycerol phosphate synthase TrpC [Vampirovibrionales bacterium]|nr:indole-3-glycerol phosphate synthase TrpC [Vampirovibrionales bacterium]